MNDDELRDLADQYAEAGKAGDTYKMLTVADTMLHQIMTQMQEGYAIQERDMQSIVMLLTSVVRLLVSRELRNPFS